MKVTYTGWSSSDSGLYAPGGAGISGAEWIRPGAYFFIVSIAYGETTIADLENEAASDPIPYDTWTAGITGVPGGSRLMVGGRFVTQDEVDAAAVTVRPTTTTDQPIASIFMILDGVAEELPRTIFHSSSWPPGVGGEEVLHGHPFLFLFGYARPDGTGTEWLDEDPPTGVPFRTYGHHRQSITEPVLVNHLDFSNDGKALALAVYQMTGSFTGSVSAIQTRESTTGFENVVQDMVCPFRDRLYMGEPEMFTQHTVAGGRSFFVPERSTARATQVSLEVAASTTEKSNARVTQEILEVAASTTEVSNARATQIIIEVASST